MRAATVGFKQLDLRAGMIQAARQTLALKEWMSHTLSGLALHHLVEHILAESQCDTLLKSLVSSTQFRSPSLALLLIKDEKFLSNTEPRGWATSKTLSWERLAFFCKSLRKTGF